MEPPSYGSSISYMMAMAVLFGYKHIFVGYVQFMCPREAYIEAPNFMVWATTAAARGAYVHLDRSRLGEVYQYGFEDRWIPDWSPEALRNDMLIRSSPEVVALERECKIKAARWEQEYYEQVTEVD